MNGYELLWRFSAKETISSTLDKLDKRVADSRRIMNATGNSIEKVMSKMGNSLKGAKLDVLSGLGADSGMLSSLAGSLSNPYVLAGAAASAFVMAAKKASDMNREWDYTMGKVNVTAQLNKSELSGLSDKLKEIAKNSAVEDFMQVPEAFNRIISANGDVEKSLSITRYATMASQAGYADLTQAADAGANIMNAVGIENISTKRTYDILFATMNKGKAEFNDIANYLPRIIPLAKTLGINFEQTAASFAFMTSKGNSVEQSTMLMQNLFQKLGDTKITDNLKLLTNVDVFKGGKMRQMSAIFDDMNKSLAGLNDQQRTKILDKIGFDQQSMEAFNIFMSDTERFKEFVNFVNNSENNGGQLEQALTNSANKLNEMRQTSNEIKSIWLSFGKVTEPIFDSINSGFASVLRSIRGNWNKGLTVGIGHDENLGGMPTINFGYRQFKSLKELDAYDKGKQNWAKLQSDLAEAKTKDDKFKVINSQSFLTNTQKFEELAKITAWAEKNPAIANKKPETSVKEQSKLTAAGNRIANSKAGENIGLGGGGVGGGGFGGSDTRNVIVNIQKLVEKIEVVVTNGSGITTSKIKQHVEEVLIAAVRDSELALAHR